MRHFEANTEFSELSSNLQWQLILRSQIYRQAIWHHYIMSMMKVPVSMKLLFKQLPKFVNTTITANCFMHMVLVPVYLAIIASIFIFLWYFSIIMYCFTMYESLLKLQIIFWKNQNSRFLFKKKEHK